MPMQSARARGLLIALFFLGLASSQGCVYVAGFGPPEIETVVVEPSSRMFEMNRIALIDISGFISSEDAGPIFGQFTTTVADIRERLKRASKDWRVRAVVLRINSPGGEVTAADIIRQQIVSFRKATGKAVIAHLMSVAASGGYYVATGADRVIANPTTTTGSVGVIMEFYNVKELFDKVGVRRVTVKSGEKKDMGSSARELTDEERAILQGITDQYFGRFVEVVKKGRPGMSQSQLETIKDGRIMTAADAVGYGMVDRVGYMDDAIREALLASRIASADLVMYRRGHTPNLNMYAQTETAVPPDWAAIVKEGVKALTRGRGPTFLYLWQP